MRSHAAHARRLKARHSTPCRTLLRSLCSAPCRFSLGGKPPQVTGIKVYSTDAAADSIVLEVEGMWASHQDVQLTVRSNSITRNRDRIVLHSASPLDEKKTY